MGLCPALRPGMVNHPEGFETTNHREVFMRISGTLFNKFNVCSFYVRFRFMQSRISSFRFLGRFLGRLLSRFWGRIFLTGLGGLGLLFLFLSQGPDINLSLTRQIPSDLDPARLERNISAVTRWPQWFYSLDTVKLLDSSTLKSGAHLELQIDSKKGKWKRFSLKAKVLEYTPGQILRLQILDDSSKRLTRLFDSLEWTIELQPKAQGSWVKGTVSAHTRHWRSRFFGQVAEKILLNQVFYPNLVKLSELRQPFTVLGGVYESSGSLLPH